MCTYKLKGEGVSPGIVMGKAYIVNNKDEYVDKNTSIKIDKDSIPFNISKFEQAVSRAKKYLSEIHDKAGKIMSKKDADIFKVYVNLLEDSFLIDGVKDIIQKQMITAQSALKYKLDEMIKTMKEIDDQYIKERMVDIKYVGKVILDFLNETNNIYKNIGDDKRIIITHQLNPIDIFQIDRNSICGFVCEKGSRTSHSTFIVRSLKIPAVVNVEGALDCLNNGDPIILDATSGDIIVNPSEEQIYKYLTNKKTLEKMFKEFKTNNHTFICTSDGTKIEIMANLSCLEEINDIIDYNVDGIGLFRTEFIFMENKTLPSEQQQFNIYKYVAEKMYPKPVIIRTLDIGGDKNVECIKLPRQPNPFLGCRGIRFSLMERSIFKTQLKAILKASMYGDIKIMYPMISTVDELVQIDNILSEVKQEMAQANLNFDENIQTGIMLETPAAVLVSDILLEKADFASIGSNDLYQYILAVDRSNPEVSNLYKPMDISVTRAIKHVVEQSNKKHKPLSVCGEIASQKELVVVLLGLGIRKLSVSPEYIPYVKSAIKSVSIEEAEKIADEFLNLVI